MKTSASTSNKGRYLPISHVLAQARAVVDNPESSRPCTPRTSRMSDEEDVAVTWGAKASQTLAASTNNSNWESHSLLRKQATKGYSGGMGDVDEQKENKDMTRTSSGVVAYNSARLGLRGGR